MVDLRDKALDSLLFCEMAQCIAKLAGLKRGRRPTFAVLGDDLRFLENRWTLFDSFADGECFMPEVFDRSAPIDSLDPQRFDVVFVSHSNPEAQKRLAAGVAAKVTRPHSVDIVDLASLIEGWSEALAAGDDDPPLLTTRKLMVLAAAVALTPKTGVVIECGIYRGATTIFTALLQRTLGIERQIFGLDTFTGMPAPTAPDINGNFVFDQGLFGNTSLGQVETAFRRHGLDKHAIAVPGLVQDTLPPLLARHVVSLALLDTDQFLSTKTALEALLPVLRTGAAILIDDTLSSGVAAAIAEIQPNLVRYHAGSPTMDFYLLIRE